MVIVFIETFTLTTRPYFCSLHPCFIQFCHHQPYFMFFCSISVCVSTGAQLYPEQSNSVNSDHQKSEVTCRRTSLDTDIFEHDYEFDICDRPRLQCVLLPSEDPWSPCIDRTSSISVASLTDSSNVTGHQTPNMLSSEALQKFIENVQLRTKLTSSMPTSRDDDDNTNNIGAAELGSFWTVSSNKEPPKPLAVLAAERRKRTACEHELTDVKQRIAQMLGKGFIRRSGLLIS